MRFSSSGLRLIFIDPLLPATSILPLRHRRELAPQRHPSAGSDGFSTNVGHLAIVELDCQVLVFIKGLFAKTDFGHWQAQRTFDFGESHACFDLMHDYARCGVADLRSVRSGLLDSVVRLQPLRSKGISLVEFLKLKYNSPFL